MPKIAPYCKRHCQGFKDTGGRCFCDDCDHSNDYWEGFDDAVEKAVKWLENNVYNMYGDKIYKLYIEDFRKAMEE